MVLVAVFFAVSVYLLFFADPGDFADGSMTPESPLLSRLFALGFLLVLFLFGLFQHALVQEYLRKLD